MPALTLRDKVGELCLSLLATVLYAALAAGVWKLPYIDKDWNVVGTLFFLIVGVESWAVLDPVQVLGEPARGDSWTRRVVLMVAGGLIGLTAVWLDGWSPGQPPPKCSWPSLDGAGIPVVQSIAPHGVISEVSYIAYYGLALFALRWWRMADRRRGQRFSLAPVLAAVFWALVLLLVGGFAMGYGVFVLACSAAVVQRVSPWEAPPPPPARRMRLRYA